MDIFTTALTRVRATPIKPEKLRVKSLRKESATAELTDDINHLEDHQLYFIDDESSNNPQHSKKNQTNISSEQVTESIEADTDAVIVSKQELLHPKQHEDRDDDGGEIKHLDIFI